MAEEKTWEDRMAVEIVEVALKGFLTVEMVKGFLEAAGEIKAVRLKVFLGRCYELVSGAKAGGSTPEPDEGFLDEVLGALR